MTISRWSLPATLLLLALSQVRVAAFVPSATSLYSPSRTSLPSSSSLLRMADSWDDGATSGAGGGAAGSIETLEFKIYPDGRVEETVRGVKGNNCQKVTEKINDKLGEVVASSPTEEMYEQEIVQSETLYTSESSDDWKGGSTW